MPSNAEKENANRMTLQIEFLRIRIDSRPFRAPDDQVQLSLDLVHLADRILPLRVRDTELLLQLLYAPLLCLRIVLEPRERGYDKLDLLFLQDQVARELNLACFELLGWDRCDCSEGWLDNQAGGIRRRSCG